MSDPLARYRAHAETAEFRALLESTEERIARWGHGEKVVVVSSWGKDSSCLVHLTRDVLRDMPPTVFHRTTWPNVPGFEEVVRELTEGLTYWEEDFLGPQSERTLRMLRHEGRTLVGSLCRWVADRGFDRIFVGRRREEDIMADRGRQGPDPPGGYSVPCGRGSLECYPLSDWTGRDVWAYIASRGVAYNRRIYDAETHGLNRETIHSGWLFLYWILRFVGERLEAREEEWLRHHFPDEVRAVDTLLRLPRGYEMTLRLLRGTDELAALRQAVSLRRQAAEV